MRRSVLLPFATAECFLPPGPMASDRHAAIARPLHYASTMATGVRALLTADSHVCGFLSASVHTADSFRLPSVVLMPSITCVCVCQSLPLGSLLLQQKHQQLGCLPCRGLQCLFAPCGHPHLLPIPIHHHLKGAPC